MSKDARSICSDSFARPRRLQSHALSARPTDTSRRTLIVIAAPPRYRLLTGRNRGRKAMADAVELTVNGARHRVRVQDDTPLLYVLRNDLELNGAKFGCGLGQCGAC